MTIARPTTTCLSRAASPALGMARLLTGTILAGGLCLLTPAMAESDGQATAVDRERPTTADTFAQLDLFSQVFERVREDYVREVEDKELVEAAINGMLTSLDPHSVFMNAEDFKDMTVQTRGEFGGLGIEVTMEDGIIKVVAPIDDTPAFRAGIEAGDFITHLEDRPIQGMTLDEAIDQLRGPVGSQVTITVVRKGREPFDVTLTRDVIRIDAVRSRIEQDVGVIRVSTFSGQAAEGVREAVETLTQQAQTAGTPLQGFVLDLRNNPGGLLDQAVEITDLFLDRGEIVSTRGRHRQDTRISSATPGDITQGAPLVVLINMGSASASEIVAGALKDQRRAIVMGEKSFGKGSVQTIIEVEPYGAMRLTTAYYYTPSGESIQATGIEPDILVRPARVEELAQARNLREEDLRGRLDNPNAPDPGTGTAPAPERAPEDAPDAAPGPGADAGGTTAPADQTETEARAAGAAAGVNAADAEGEPDPDTAEAESEKQPFDYQLARAIDLIRGVALYESTRGR